MASSLNAGTAGTPDCLMKIPQQLLGGQRVLRSHPGPRVTLSCKFTSVDWCTPAAMAGVALLRDRLARQEPEGPGRDIVNQFCEYFAERAFPVALEPNQCQADIVTFIAAAFPCKFYQAGGAIILE